MRRLVLITATLFASAANADDLTARAERLAREKPAAWRVMGYAEHLRSTGKAVDLARRAAELPRGEGRDTALEFFCWSMLPVEKSRQAEFNAVLAALTKTNPKSLWIGVFRLYAVSLAENPPALIAAATALGDPPATFPTVAAERAHYDLLKELGFDDNRAGLEVLSHRRYAALHALRDLDRTLTKEADLLRAAGRAADAKVLTDARDRLRQAWLDSSRHLIERLFALHLLGRTQDCDALLFAARELPYLTDAGELNRTLARLTPRQAATLIIQPLLASEVRVIGDPPKLPTTGPTAAPVELTIEAQGKSVQTGISTYEGAVRVTLATIMIACDKLAVLGDSPAAARQLSGAGNVVVHDAPGFPSIKADHFNFSIDTGAFSFGGNVRLQSGQRILKFRACTLSRTGELRDTVGVLDDFDAAPDDRARLDLLPKLTAEHADEELPNSVKHLLALSLLRPHLVWREAAPGEAESPIQQWLREDAMRQVRGKADPVEALLNKDKPVRLVWRLKDAGHADVVRARKLLATIETDDARLWIAAIDAGR